MFKQLLSLIKREINIIIHDKNITLIIFIAPLFYAFFYGSIYINKSEHDVKISVVDLDNSNLSKTLIKDLDAHQMIKVEYITTNLAEAKDQMNSLKTNAIIFIDKDFQKNLLKGKGTTVKAFINTTRFLPSNDINRALNEVVLSMSNDNKENFFRMAGESKKQAINMAEPITLDMHPLFNSGETYGDFLIPGIIILIIQQTLLIGLGESIAKEREFNTLKDLYKLSDKSVLISLAGKTSFYFILFCTYSLFFFTVHFNIFKLNMSGDPKVIIFFTLLFLFCVLFMGVFFASFFKRKIMALQVLAFTSYPFFFFSGFSWPFQSLPKGIQFIGMFLPTTPFMTTFIRVIDMGANFNQISGAVIHLMILCIFYLVLGVWRFRKILQEEN